MVGEHVNILKKTKLWKLRYDQSCIPNKTKDCFQCYEMTPGFKPFTVLCDCYRSDGSFHFPVLKMSTFPKIITGQILKEYYAL